MNEIPQSERIASPSQTGLESPARRLRLPRSLRPSLLRLRVISRGRLAIRFLLSRIGGDLLPHRAAQVDISNFLTHRPQPKGNSSLVPYIPSGSLTISKS